jgi:peptidoglycan/LPS O-acetylase OafA/YrhL
MVGDCDSRWNEFESFRVECLMPPREFYIDRLRSVMTVLVVLHHTAITYGATGGWFYNELKPSGTVSSLLLTMFCATNQAYFMGFFFLLAGYFTPPSLERKGYAKFIGDRLIRLGIPLLFFILVLGPLTAALAATAEGHGFLPTFVSLLNHGRVINGPLWFAQALLMFSLVYCAWRASFGAPLNLPSRTPTPLPSRSVWRLSAIAVALGAWAIRLVVPVGQNVIGLQLGYFSMYVFLYAVGITAWRHDWLSRLSWKNTRPWILALFIAWPTLPISLALASASRGSGTSSFAGGLSWPAIMYALWEPFVAWGLIAAWLLTFRNHMNQPNPFWSWLNRRAYAVYIIHPPILVGITLLLHGFLAPALLKFAVTGSLTCIACCLIADPLVRTPLLNHVI